MTTKTKTTETNATPKADPRTRVWDALKAVPESAKKQITGGRLKGFTEINPAWRLFAMTQHFGPCGVDWRYTIEKLWIEHGTGEAIAGFCLINLYYRLDGEWSDPVPGIGGSGFVEIERSGPRTSDEVYKMALTDALGVAMKAIGMGADVYTRGADYSKYTQPTGGGPEPDKESTEVSLIAQMFAAEDFLGVYFYLAKLGKDSRPVRKEFTERHPAYNLADAERAGETRWNTVQAGIEHDDGPVIREALQCSTKLGKQLLWARLNVDQRDIVSRAMK